MNDIIKPGMRFMNGFMECTVIGYTEVNGKNLALLLCSNDGLFITVRNLQLWQGQWVWDWGHYYSSLNEAIRDYNERKKDL